MRLGFLLVLLFSFAMYSCGSQSEGNAPSSSLAPEVGSPAPPTTLVISPPAALLSVNNQQTFVASGGSGGYFYSVLSGSGSVLSTTGVYTAPLTAGTAVVRVTDSSGQTADAVVSISPALQISPANLSLTVNQTSTFTTTGGVGAVLYTLVSGSGSLNGATGEYTAPASVTSALIRATDSRGNTADANINVYNGLGLSPNPATVSIDQTVTFSTAGGVAPYTYTILSGAGNINSSGLYTAPAATGVAVVRVSDSLGQTADASVTIQNVAPVISAISDEAVNEDTQISVNFTITDADSTLSCGSSVTASSSNTTLIPISNIVFSGLAPNCTALITPTNDLTGLSHIQFMVSDGFSSSVEPFSVKINGVNDAPVISGVSAQSVSEDSSLIVNFTINDIDDSLDCSSSMTASTSTASLVASSGILFSGVAPNCSATITPEANQNGSVHLTIRVSDSGGLFADRTFAVSVTPVNDDPTISGVSAQSVKSDANLNVNYAVNDIDSALNCTSQITVVSSNPAVLPLADIVKAGTAPNCTLQINPSLNVAGTSLITVTISDGSLSQNMSFNLSVINVSSLAVSPASLTLAVAGTSQLQAIATYSDASTQAVTASLGITWSSSVTAVATVNNTTSKGLVTGVTAGATNVSATYKGVSSNSAAVNVISATSITVSSGSITGGIGSVRQITATAQNSSTAFDVTNTAVWSSSNPSVASVSNGLITFNSAGSALVTVTYAGLSAAVHVVVQSKTLVSLSLSGGSSGVALNGTVNMVATATYSDASTEIVTDSVTWSSTNTSVISVSNSLPTIGRITGLAVGSSTISAVIGAVSNSQLVNVNSVTITSIAVTPNDALVASNASYSLRAVATYSDASTSDVTELVNWSSSNTSAATVSNVAGTKGMATTPTFTGYRTTTISATLNSVVGTTPFGVNGATITSIQVTPIITLTVPQVYQLKAYGNLSDGGSIDLTEFAVWSSASPAQVTVSNSSASRGLVTAVSIGTSSVTASFAGVSGSRTVTVGASASMTEIGVGLRGAYYTWVGAPPPANPFILANQRGTRIDQRINFAWGAGNAPMGVGNQFAVRWTGFYKATATTNYFCTNSDDGVRVWINGVLIINNWTEHGPTWDCSANQALVVGTKYSVVVEYYENGGGSEIHLTRSSVSAADAQNTTTRAIPQTDLYLP